MTIKELTDHLQAYSPEAEIKCGISIPALYINTVANLSISGNHVDPAQCNVVRIITATPDVRPPDESQNP